LFNKTEIFIENEGNQIEGNTYKSYKIYTKYRVRNFECISQVKYLS